MIALPPMVHEVKVEVKPIDKSNTVIYRNIGGDRPPKKPPTPQRPIPFPTTKVK